MQPENCAIKGICLAAYLTSALLKTLKFPLSNGFSNVVQYSYVSAEGRLSLVAYFLFPSGVLIRPPASLKRALTFMSPSGYSTELRFIQLLDAPDICNENHCAGRTMMSLETFTLLRFSSSHGAEL